ncbi:MAG: GNAT family N-acetyltransferase [Desulfobacterales bacterium]
MENVRIRALAVEDAPEIVRIYSAITRKPAGDELREVIEDHARRRDGACFVAEQDGRIVGFMISTILTAGFGLAKSAWISTIGVRPDQMGRGIGASLAAAVFEYYRAQGIDTVYTSVRWDSTDLLSFFKTLGFDRSNFINLRKVLV